MKNDIVTLFERAIASHIGKETGIPVTFKATSSPVLVIGKSAYVMADLPVTPEDKMLQKLSSNYDDLLKLHIKAFEAYQKFGAAAACRELRLAGNLTGLPDGRLLLIAYMLRVSIHNDRKSAVAELTKAYGLQNGPATIKRLERAAKQESVKIDLPHTWPSE